MPNVPCVLWKLFGFSFQKLLGSDWLASGLVSRGLLIRCKATRVIQGKYGRLVEMMLLSVSWENVNTP